MKQLRRLNMKKILRDPILRRGIVARGTVFVSAVEGIDISLKESYRIYDEMIKGRK